MIAIRPAASSDIPALARLAREQAECQAELDAGLQVKPNADWSSYVAARLCGSNTTILVADRGGELLGYIDIRIRQQGPALERSRLKASLRRLLNRLRKVQPSVLGDKRYSFKAQPSVLGDRRYGFIEDIYVTPRLRRTGAAVFNRLFQHGMAWLGQRGAGEVEGVISASNEAVLDLAQKLGFQRVRVVVRKKLESPYRLSSDTPSFLRAP